MSPVYISIFVLLYVLYMQRRRRKKTVRKSFAQLKKHGEEARMLELAGRFINKECIIYTVDEHQITGVIKEISDGAVLVYHEKDSTCEAVNITYIIRIREYPKNKNGKKKSVVID